MKAMRIKWIAAALAVLLAGCGKVDDFTRIEGMDIAGDTELSLTDTPAAEAETAVCSGSVKNDETTVSKKKRTEKTENSCHGEAVTTVIPVSPPLPASTEETECPEQPAEKEPEQPSGQPVTNDNKTPPAEQHPDIFQPAWFVGHCYEFDWSDNCDLLRNGYTAVIRNTDDLRAYMEPIYPDYFIQKYIDFYTEEIMDGEDFFKDNLLLVNSLAQGSGTEPMVKIDRFEPSESMVNISFSWKYEPECSYADVMSVCFLQVTAGRDMLKDKGILWTMNGGDGYTLNDEDKNIFSQLKNLDYTPVTCDGLPEYTLTAPDGTFYQLNLSGRWVWKNMKDEEAELPGEIVSWLRENGSRIGMKIAEWN